MHLFCVLMLSLCCILTISGAQYFSSTNQERLGKSYSQTSALTSSYSQQSPSNSFYNQGRLYPYSDSALVYQQPANRKGATWNYKSSSPKGNFQNSIPAALPINPLYKSYAHKQYSGGTFNANNSKRDTRASEFGSSNKVNKKSISKADAENAKFAGAENQENDGSRTLHLKRKKFNRRFNRFFINPCSFYGRDASKSFTPPPKEQGRFLWDIHVHNYYPQNSLGLGCGGYGGLGPGGLGPGGLGPGGLGAGLLSDPIGPGAYSPGAGIANFLSYFAPGILQNSLAVNARPQQLADYSVNDLQNDPEVDPNYRPEPAAVPVRRPNQILYDSAGAPLLTSAQLVGGISTTVNDIIQTFTGNVRPAYG